MRLVIGGYAQGKFSYVMERYGIQEAVVLDGTMEMTTMSQKNVVINHFHKWVKGCLEKGRNPEPMLEEFLKKNPNCIIISDEVGNGIVPMEPFEREYRERLGRCLIELAKKAESVERVICGIGQKIK
ncbi:MAG: bifunctional adenosylcobinamide kinase/adenosylcobinamide-phosphate guanylyltransferase [Lachnospiraceae bacterium]|nr:bifunctional adenosylcobinamide kinase/adenosylcobinamide-phosphate guanylyltransferase [Lachnospiraceae bacterium]